MKHLRPDGLKGENRGHFLTCLVKAFTLLGDLGWTKEYHPLLHTKAATWEHVWLGQAPASSGTCESRMGVEHAELGHGTPQVT